MKESGGADDDIDSREIDKQWEKRRELTLMVEDDGDKFRVEEEKEWRRVVKAREGESR